MIKIGSAKIGNSKISLARCRLSTENLKHKIKIGDSNVFIFHTRPNFYYTKGRSEMSCKARK